MATMKAHTEYLTFHTEERYEMVHITPQVEKNRTMLVLSSALWSGFSESLAA